MNYSTTDYSLDVVSTGTTYSTPFTVIFYTCEDPNCATCTFDLSDDVTTLVSGSPNCTLCDTGYAGTPCTETTIICGDGIVEKGEMCDDGNTVNGDGCSSTCKLEWGFDCVGTKPTVCTKLCLSGEGYSEGSECIQCNDTLITGVSYCSTCDVSYLYTQATFTSNCTACDDGYNLESSSSKCILTNCT